MKIFSEELYKKAEEILPLKVNDSTFENVAKNLISQWIHYENRDTIKKWFSVFNLDYILSEDKFNKIWYCSKIKNKIYRPCQLKSCICHIDNPFFMNCIDNYMEENGISSLTENEICFLCNLKLEDIYKSLDDSIIKLQINDILKNQEGSFHYLNSSKVCCVCESIIEDKFIFLNVGDKKLAYCSKECMEKKGKLEIELEVMYGFPIENILKWFHIRFRYLDVISDVLEINLKELENLFDKYNITKNYSPKIKEICLSRHSSNNPTMLKNILDNSGLQDSKIIKIYGKPNLEYLDFKEMDRKLTSICNYGL